jgi:sigma-B regulation protein RsbU (phosphoserine phosphatase)
LVTSFYQPHFEVGGDYYDFIEMGKNEFGFCIADVSGKGMAAALLMSNFQATLRALFTRDIPLDMLIERLNDRVMSNTNGEKFITFFIGRYKLDSKQLEYINAAHNPPLLYEIGSSNLSFLRDGSVGLGMLDSIPVIKIGHCTIADNSKLLCYTDGLVELMVGDDISATTDLLEKQLSNNKDIEQTIQDIISELCIVEGNKSIIDDITILGIQFF